MLIVSPLDALPYAPAIVRQAVAGDRQPLVSWLAAAWEPYQGPAARPGCPPPQNRRGRLRSATRIERRRTPIPRAKIRRRIADRLLLSEESPTTASRMVDHSRSETCRSQFHP